ncbi:zf-DHHC-domain-containing protein [Thelephora ganbajun]|uniref:Zf-DHHC-domain-containing protein n=1 Tax=Thelephora ganbajun TaxID=370292 RepID=A0ACB6ZCW0_THEGA|nr:zf-DHHC-domain-containing protein [Thelephora ganbajun]
MGKLLGRVFVCFTIMLISFNGYSSQIFIIWPWYGREVSVDLLKLIIPFNFLLAMLWWNYYLCIMTDPGRVPPQWEPDVSDKQDFEINRLGKPRYCRNCKRYKPPRAHHCKDCKTCVLRMDHHCPWVNNCLGLYNYGHFVRFLFYVDVTCSYHVFMITYRALSSTKNGFWVEPDPIELVFLIMNYVTCVPVLAAVGAFSLYHLHCLLGNSTTIEGWEKDKVAKLVRRGEIREIKFPYNLGMMKNVKAILGPNPLLWCWPTVPPGDGLSFEIVQDGEYTGQWPPEDPATRMDENHIFTLPKDPWTYGNGSFNPDLHSGSSNHGLRERRGSPTSRQRHSYPYTTEGGQTDGTYAVPPYHPDYDESQPSYGHFSQPPYADGDEDEDEDEDARYYEDRPQRRQFIRRGSEGYEVHAIDREEMMRRYVESQARLGEAGRYRPYVPERWESEEDEEVEQIPNGLSVQG